MKGKMNHHHHRQKKKRNAFDGDSVEEDRISALPDSILSGILSFIDTKSAVETSLLSNRWRYLWIFVTNLHFDHKRFAGPCDHTKKRRFTNFVNRVLSLRNGSKIFSFSLECESFWEPSLVSKCFCYAIRHNVQQLHLNVACRYAPFQFPSTFNYCESLKVLKLVLDFCDVSLDQPLCLPAVNTLHLEGVKVGFNNFIAYTIRNCPNLETLVLSNLGGPLWLDITCPQLRRLELSHLSDIWEIRVSAPLLTSFRFQDTDLPFSFTANLPCLEDAYIDLCPGRLSPNEVKQMALTTIKMLGQLLEAKSITLSIETLEVLATDPDSLRSHPSPFQKLKYLKLAPPREFSTINLPLNVISYLTEGSKPVAPLS